MRIPSPATVMSAIALVASLGTGGAYAATQLKANSVGSREIRAHSVQLSDLATNARPGAISKARAAQVVEDVITDPAYNLKITVAGVQGEKGDAGPAGGPGATGAAGAPSLQKVTIRSSENQYSDGGTGESWQVRCEPGERVLSGGGYVSGAAATMTSSLPIDGDLPGWTVSFDKSPYSSGTIHAFAVCAEVTA